jgi:class I fructose-bisphosphate aldolase
MKTLVKRPILDELDLPVGKKVRLYRILYEHGPGNGTALLLPIDHGLEHGPIDFFENPDSIDPEFQLRLCEEGKFSGIVFHIGLAQKYMKKYAGKVPLILKLNGKTNIPPDDEAFSPQTASVEDAVRLGADAVGYTLYVGSPRQSDDFIQLEKIRRDCDRYSMPLIIWSYPRGKYVEEKGGRDCLYAVDYAARVANELGADMVKLNMPEFVEEKMKKQPKNYSTLKLSDEEAVAKVVKSAGKAMVLISGGGKISDEELLHKVEACMRAGCTGFIFGRNMWQRKFNEALAIAEKVKKIMLSY